MIDVNRCPETAVQTRTFSCDGPQGWAVFAFLFLSAAFAVCGVPSFAQSDFAVADPSECEHVLTTQFRNCEFEKVYFCPNNVFVAEQFKDRTLESLEEMTHDGDVGNYVNVQDGTTVEIKDRKLTFSIGELIGNGVSAGEAMAEMKMMAGTHPVRATYAATLTEDLATVSGQEYAKVQLNVVMALPSLGVVFDMKVDGILLEQQNMILHYRTVSNSAEFEPLENDTLMSISFPGEAGFEATSARHNCGELS